MEVINVTEEAFEENASIIPSACDMGLCNQTEEQNVAAQNPSTILFEFITNGILLSVVGILGLVGNIMSIIILSRPQMRSSINCILIGLSSFDAVLLCTSILMFGLPAVYRYTETVFFTYYWDVFPHITPYTYPIGLIAQTGSVYLTLTVTIERYVAVCHPLKARSLCTYGRARFYVIVIGTLAIVYNIPRFFEVITVTEFYPFLNRNVTIIEPSPLRSNNIYVKVYINWMYLFAMYFIPFSCLALFNAAIYRQVRIANMERARLSRLQKKEIGLAVMLLCVVIVFFICNILALIINILEPAGIMIDELTRTSNFLVTINSSVNFIIYCIFGEKFKRLFLKLFCKYYWSSGKESPDGTNADDSVMSVHANGDGRGYLLKTNFRQSVKSFSDGRPPVSYKFKQNCEKGNPTRENTMMTSFASRTSFSSRTASPKSASCVYYPAGENSSNQFRNTHRLDTL